jgi:pyruvate/2-oxoglutarate/acetoin dehydrogenase E1 component
MQRELTYKDAINEALHQEMRADPTVFLIGEDVAGGAGNDHIPGALDAWGGPFGVTKNLVKEFGRTRVIDSLLAETGFVGASIGAALAGLKPVAEIMYVDFLGTSFDQIMNHAAKLRFTYGGKIGVPLVIRTVTGAGFRSASEHSQMLISIFTHIPGLKVIAPSNAYDAKGLLIAAIRDPNPVIFMEHKRLYMQKTNVPTDSYEIPIGVGDVKRSGTNITIVGVQKMVMTALDAAEILAKKGISAEVIDPRTYSPLDINLICESVSKTGLLLVVDESYPRCSIASDIASQAGTLVFKDLKGPIRTLTGLHTSIPFSPPLEDFFIPSIDDICNYAERMVKGEEIDVKR